MNWKILRSRIAPKVASYVCGIFYLICIGKGHLKLRSSETSVTNQTTDWLVH